MFDSSPPPLLPGITQVGRDDGDTVRPHRSYQMPVSMSCTAINGNSGLSQPVTSCGSISGRGRSRSANEAPSAVSKAHEACLASRRAIGEYSPGVDRHSEVSPAPAGGGCLGIPALLIGDGLGDAKSPPPQTFDLQRFSAEDASANAGFGRCSADQRPLDTRTKLRRCNKVCCSAQHRCAQRPRSARIPDVRSDYSAGSSGDASTVSCGGSLLACRRSSWSSIRPSSCALSTFSDLSGVTSADTLIDSLGRMNGMAPM